MFLKMLRIRKVMKAYNGDWANNCTVLETDRNSSPNGRIQC